MRTNSRLWKRTITLVAVVAGAFVAPSLAQETKPDARAKKDEPSFVVPPVASLRRLTQRSMLTQEEGVQARYILRTESHPVGGDAYLVVTDHRDDAYLAPLRRLAEYHKGTVMQVEDLGALADKPVRDALVQRLREAKPGYVAVAPRLESFRENMLLGLWGALASLDDDREIDVRPGLLVAPDTGSFAALIDRSIAHRPTARSSFRPFVVSQVGDSSPMGTRSLQKLGVLREMFGKLGVKTPGLVVRQIPGDEPRLEGDDIWVARTPGRRQLLAVVPAAAAEAFAQSSMVLMFGHGVPGVVCGMRVDTFDQLAFTNKVVLCGSCMSSAPTKSDWGLMAVGPDGAKVFNDRKRFLMESVERGAVVTYAHMRMNAGFPHMFPVVESMLRGETVGEAYQLLLDGLLTWTRLQPDELVLKTPAADDDLDTMRRNQLLYTLVGDPALRPLERIEGAPAPAAD